jgi:hypothetical protein
MPYTAKVADDLLFIKSLHTEQINHDPAVTFSRPLPDRRPAQPRRVGDVRTGDDESGSSAFVVMITGKACRWLSGSGELASCRANIRASSCDRSAIRCSMSPILPDMTSLYANTSSTISRS